MVTIGYQHAFGNVIRQIVKEPCSAWSGLMVLIGVHQVNRSLDISRNASEGFWKVLISVARDCVRILAVLLDLTMFGFVQVSVL